MRAQLARMTPAAAEAAAEDIRLDIPSLPRWQDAQVVAAYAALAGEPDLRPFDWTKNKSVLLPRSEGETLIFHAVENPSQLKAGAFGVMEPDPEKCPVADINDAEIIFVPGLAFTADGARLGRGRGFYDRLLASLSPQALRVGVCFASQIVDAIPSEPHDKEVDLVLSQQA